jgi:hypothetical protein
MQERGCTALHYLAQGTAREQKTASGKIVAERVVASMKRHASKAPVQENGCLAIWSLVLIPNNGKEVVSAGAIGAVVAAMTRHLSDSDVQHNACIALKHLAKDNDSNQKAIATAGGIEALVAALNNKNFTSAVVQEEACAAVAALACNNVPNRALLLAGGGRAAVEAAMLQHQSDFFVQKNGAVALKELCPAPEKLVDERTMMMIYRTTRLEAGPVKTLYHQTNATAAAAIVMGQKFYRGASGSAGGGIYFATSIKATHRKALASGPVLQADVRLGMVKRIHGCDSSMAFRKLADDGYDSVQNTYFDSGTEFIVYNFDQVSNIKYAPVLPPLSTR